MQIEKVELIYIKKDKSDIPNFVIHWKDTKQTTALLSNSVGNRHYVEVREWYKAQKKKPFKFDFEG